MVRTFATHKIRKTQEISSCLWDFYTLPEQGKEEAVKGKAAVPGCWESCPDTRTYRGRACYERDISCSGNVRIEFKGVSHTAQVYLDGREIASHYNAYTPFSAVVKGLGGGKHHLKVIADNSFRPQSALHVPNDYQSYGGITRPVVLEELNDSYITGVHFTPVRKDGKWYASVQGELENISDHFFRGKVILYLGEQEIHSAVVEAGPDSKAAFAAKNLPCGQAEEWSPENPVLYHLTAVLQDDMGNDMDDWIDRVGFREIRMEGKDILLNGRKIRIKGFCRHEDHPQFGCAIPFQAMQQDLMLMKDMGANSVRTSHYPNDELFLDLCDETGFLVWEENHARGLSEKDMRNPNFEKQCEDCIRE